MEKQKEKEARRVQRKLERLEGPAADIGTSELTVLTDQTMGTAE